ncbi:hypothetical protein ABIB36_001797 [Rhodococcus sp. UYP9]
MLLIHSEIVAAYMTATSRGVATTLHAHVTEGLFAQMGDKAQTGMFNSGAGHILVTTRTSHSRLTQQRR